MGMMGKCCRYRKNKRNEKEQELIINRLNRISGQVSGIKKMVNDNVYCADVLVQLQAVEKAVKSLSNIMIEAHLYGCLTEEFENGKFESVDEIANLFKMLNK